MAESGPATLEPSTVSAGNASSNALQVPILAFFCGGGQALVGARPTGAVTVGKLKLDTPVAAEHVFADAVLQRLELAVAGRHQALGETPRLIRYLTTEVARALDSSQLEGNCGLAMGRMSVWPSTCKAQSISGGMTALQLDDGHGQLVDGGEPFHGHGRLPGGEQHLGLEHEAIADHADVFAIRSNSRRRPKKSER